LSAPIKRSSSAAAASIVMVVVRVNAGQVARTDLAAGSFHGAVVPLKRARISLTFVLARRDGLGPRPMTLAAIGLVFGGAERGDGKECCRERETNDFYHVEPLVFSSRRPPESGDVTDLVTSRAAPRRAFPTKTPEAPTSGTRSCLDSGGYSGPQYLLRIVEHDFGSVQTYSGLVGVLSGISDKLAIDAAVRGAIIAGEGVSEMRGGFSLAVP
jgi:hypothetical protein